MEKGFFEALKREHHQISVLSFKALDIFIPIFFG
jgi:hypothetical protein